MLATMRKVVAFRMTIAEWIGTAIMLLVPYFVVGVVWALFHTHQFAAAAGFHRVVLIVGTVASWPALLISGTHFA
jgi:hypothetical protein